MVDRQPIGRQDVRAHDDPHVLPSQSGPHDAGLLLIPVGPEHQAETETGGHQSPTAREEKTKEGQPEALCQDEDVIRCPLRYTR